MKIIAERNYICVNPNKGGGVNPYPRLFKGADDARRLDFSVLDIMYPTCVKMLT